MVTSFGKVRQASKQLVLNDDWCWKRWQGHWPFSWLKR